MMAKKLSSYSYTLPEELWFDILCRLSVVSLLRCRCVCKTWHHIIGTCSFVKTHVAYQNSSSSNKYMLYDGLTLWELFRDFKSLCDVTKHSKLYYTMKSFGRSYNFVQIYGVCNGLLCLSDKDYCLAKDIYLWNPICRKIKKLPQLKFDEATRREIKTFGYFELHNDAGLSFGYYDDDYKVIVISPIQEEQFRIIVSIYSLGTNSWKIICTNYFLGKEYDKYDHFKVTKFVNGTAYMLASTYPTQSVICFSLSDETVRVIKSPRKFDALSHVNIEAYGETIAVLGSYDQSGFDYLDMYILRSNESLSWETKFSMKLQKHSRCPRWTLPLGFSNNGKYIVRTIDVVARHSSSWVVKLFWCDLDSGKLTPLKLRKQVVRSDVRFGLVEARIHSNCMESLLLLNEDSLDPYVPVEMELSCSSVLFTLDNWIGRANPLSLYGGKKETYKQY